MSIKISREKKTTKAEKQIEVYNDVISTFLSFYNTLKFNHWLTDSYIYHIVCDELLENTESIVDSISEILLSNSNIKDSIRNTTKELKIVNPNLYESERMFIEYLNKINVLINEYRKIFESYKLINILSLFDDMSNNIDNAIYKLNLTLHSSPSRKNQKLKTRT